MNNPSSKPVLWILCLFVAVGLGLPGCGGDGDDEKKRPTASAGDLDDARAKAEAARDLANKKKAETLAKKEYKSAIAAMEMAAFDETDGEPGKAARGYDTAARIFGRAVSTAEEALSKRKEFEPQIAEFNKKREELVKIGVDKLAPSYLEYADTEFEKAMKAIERGRKPKFKDAINYLNDAAKVAEDKTKEKGRADALLADLGNKRQLALEEKADEFAIRDMTEAENLERRGKNQLEDGEFEQAQTSFGDAIALYARAVAESRRKQGLASATDNTPGFDSGDNTPVNPGGSDSSEEAPEIGRIDPPTDDGDEGEGDLDVLANLSTLFHGGPNYSNGLLELEYTMDGPSLQKDALIMKQGTLGENIFFKGKTHSGTDDYTFGGNEQSGFILNARFKKEVIVKLDVTFQIWGAEATRFFEIWVNYDPKSEDRQFLQIGNQGILAASWQNNSPKSAKRSKVKQHAADVNRWLVRRDSHVFIVALKPNEKGVNEMIVVMDGDEIIRRKIKGEVDGFVGVRWKDSKFFVTETKVRGGLDMEWAKARLGKKDTSGGSNDLDGF